MTYCQRHVERAKGGRSPTNGPAIQRALKVSPNSRINHQVIELFGNQGYGQQIKPARATARRSINSATCSDRPIVKGCEPFHLMQLAATVNGACELCAAGLPAWPRALNRPKWNTLRHSATRCSLLVAVRARQVRVARSATADGSPSGRQRLWPVDVSAVVHSDDEDDASSVVDSIEHAVGPATGTEQTGQVIS